MNAVERKRPLPTVIPSFVCVDGYEMSVQASAGHYCRPRQDWPANGWSHVEVMADINDPRWKQYEAGGVYGYVPLELVRELIAAHGGIATGLELDHIMKQIDEGAR